jgi:aminopeptidase N
MSVKRIWFLVLLLIAFQSISAHDGYLRDMKADVLHYEFAVTINDTTSRIEGQTRIIVKFLGICDSISFDLKKIDNDGIGMKVTSISFSNEELKWKHINDRLIILLPKHVNENDTLEFFIQYSGVPSDGLIISKNKFGNRTFFADHWPNRAHNYLPCIDHPYDKASVDFVITAPDKYKVVASGMLVEESDLQGPMTLTHWSEAVPLATKVMTFGAAQFAVKFAGEVNSIPVWSWVYPENRIEGFSDYAVAVRPLDYYSKVIGPYPYKKLANVQSKTIYGGLENAGTIFYSERSVTGKGRAEGLIAHEIAHQWFGNCVTEADWHHVWLSEGFATYMTELYFESTQGSERLESDMKKARELILKFYDKNKKPIVDTTITKLMDLLSVNSYQKGAWVLHMLRNKIGNDVFMSGLKLFYERFYNSNALTSDFTDIMEEVSGADLDTFFKQWLYTGGQPELSISQKAGRKKGTIEVSILQKQQYLFEFDLELLVRDKSGERVEKIAVKDKLTKIILSASEDVEIVPDPAVKLLFK